MDRLNPTAEPSRLSSMHRRYHILKKTLFIMALAMTSLFCELSQAVDLPANIVNSALSPALKTAPRRMVAVRYQAEDLLTTSGSTDPASSSSQFAVNLLKEMNSSHAGRAILPDPFATNHTGHWLSASRELAENGMEVWFELAPKSLLNHEMDSDKTVPILVPESLKNYETAMIKRVRELAELRTGAGKPVASGLFLPLTPPVGLPSGSEAGLNESTFRLFLQETGLEGEWSQRLANDDDRKAFVRSAGLMPWLTWRSRRVSEFYRAIADQTHELTGLKLTIAAPAFSSESSQSLFDEAERTGVSPMNAWRWMAFEPSLWRSSASLEVIGSESLAEPRIGRELVAHPDMESALDGLSVRGHWLSQPMSKQPETGPEISNQAGNRGLGHIESALVCYMSRHDAQWLMIDRSAIKGHELKIADWNRRFERLPLISVDEESVGRISLQGMTIRTFPISNSSLVAFFNPLPCRMEVELVSLSEDSKKNNVRFVESFEAARSLRNESGTTIHLIVPPKSWGHLELESGITSTVSFKVSLPEEAKDIVQTRYDELMEHRSKPQPNMFMGVQSNSEKTRGRRLMAALQAYRESRLADFFRLSDGISVERRHGRGVERTARGFTDDLSNRPKIR